MATEQPELVCHLLRLPRELRDIIWTYTVGLPAQSSWTVFISSKRTVAHTHQIQRIYQVPHAQKNHTQRQRWKSANFENTVIFSTPALAHSNSQIRPEVMAIYFSQNAFDCIESFVSWGFDGMNRVGVRLDLPVSQMESMRGLRISAYSKHEGDHLKSDPFQSYEVTASIDETGCVHVKFNEQLLQESQSEDSHTREASEGRQLSVYPCTYEDTQYSVREINAGPPTGAEDEKWWRKRANYVR